MIKAILTTFVYFLCLVMVLWFGYMAGSYRTLDYCSEGVKSLSSITQPTYTATKYYRYGGGDAFEDQMQRIRNEGKQEFITAWDKWCVDFRPWHTLKGAL